MKVLDTELKHEIATVYAKLLDKRSKTSLDIDDANNEAEKEMLYLTEQKCNEGLEELEEMASKYDMKDDVIELARQKWSMFF